MKKFQILIAALMTFSVAGAAQAQTVYYAGFQRVPANHAPNTMYTEAIAESNGAGWLTGPGVSGENQYWVDVRLTATADGRQARVIPHEYRVTFEVVPDETTARNQDQATGGYFGPADYDLYSLSNDPNNFPMLWDPDALPTYRYDIVVPANESRNGLARRIFLRTFQDPLYPRFEGYESVVLRITDVEFTASPAPAGVAIVVGDLDQTRWLIRDTWFHTPSTIPPPTSDIVSQFSHSTPWMAGVDYNFLSYNPSPGSTTNARTQPSVKFLAEGDSDFGDGRANEDYTGIRFYTMDQISTCTETLPLGCGNVVGAATSGECPLRINFQIDLRSTARWSRDYRLYDFFTKAELIPDHHGRFSTTVPIRENTGRTQVGHVIQVDVYQNEPTSWFDFELPYEELIVHMTGLENTEDCTASLEPEVGWSSVAVWIIQDVPSP